MRLKDKKDYLHFTGNQDVKSCRSYNKSLAKPKFQPRSIWIHTSLLSFLPPTSPKPLPGSTHNCEAATDCGPKSLGDWELLAIAAKGHAWDWLQGPPWMGSRGTACLQWLRQPLPKPPYPVLSKEARQTQVWLYFAVWPWASPLTSLNPSLK